jgi:hypothetical protein
VRASGKIVGVADRLFRFCPGAQREGYRLASSFAARQECQVGRRGKRMVSCQSGCEPNGHPSLIMHMCCNAHRRILFIPDLANVVGVYGIFILPA